ncbi:MAG: TROVE domain-containing protein [Verrucomicrobiales bacterium]|nr:TROVE domain-containing protein [Verrucomicrobiales bacterium]
MANRSLFQSLVGRLLPATDVVNQASAPAYALTPKAALAQYAATGCLNSTFYAGAREQLSDVLTLCREIEPEFIARAAVFARERGAMKDMPALLCAVLASRDGRLLGQVFDRVIDNGRMLRSFVQILRSGTTGRKSLGTVPKRLVRGWLAARSEDQLFRASVGQSPSLGDVIKMVHPRPASATREAFYGYLLERKYDADALPSLVAQYEAFKAGQREVVPDVPFSLLTAMELDREAWTGIARQAPWQTTRMNLNTFARHGVFETGGMADLVAERLRNPAAVQRARVFPYQLLSAYRSTDDRVPAIVRDALQDALELATQNVPEIAGKVYVFPDVSGSMQSPVTGNRKGSSTSVRCVDVAALMAACVLRRNPSAEVLPFAERVIDLRLNARDSVMTNAEKLASLPPGGTNCSEPLARLNRRRAQGDLVIYVSDNQSWLDAPRIPGWGMSPTNTMAEWSAFKRRNPRARMVCLDIQPYGNTQAQERTDILNIGGFSDAVFEVIAAFARGELAADHLIGVIEQIEL